MDEIVRRTQETTSTGRDNNNYDPYLSKTFNLALQRKIGNDPEFESFQKRYRGVQTTAGGAGGGSNGSPHLCPIAALGKIDEDRAGWVVGRRRGLRLA